MVLELWPRRVAYIYKVRNRAEIGAKGDLNITKFKVQGSSLGGGLENRKGAGYWSILILQQPSGTSKHVQKKNRAAYWQK